MRRAPSRLGVVVLLIVQLTGCATAPSTSRGGPSQSPADGATLRPPEQATPLPTFPPDDVTRVVIAATGGIDPPSGDLDRQWRGAFPYLVAAAGRTYSAPAAVLGYRAGGVPDTECARGRPASIWRNNARYCPADHRIVYDEDWVRSLTADVGPPAALAILAHEWGHHIQSAVDLQAEDLRKELQADCYAGMYLSASPLLSHASVDAEEPALLAAMASFYRLGNEHYRASEWFASQEHGSPAQRIMSTSTGLQSIQRILPTPVAMEVGLRFCAGYAEYQVGDVARVGPYRFVEFPGRTSSTTNGVYLMDRDDDTTLPSSRVLLAWLDPLPRPGGATLEQLKAIWTTSWPGIRTDYQGEALRTMDLRPASSGTGIAIPYEWTDPKDASKSQSGVFGLVAPEGSTGGLLILVFRPERWPRDRTAMVVATEEAITTTYEAMSRLCTPDESASPGASNLDPACSEVQ